MTIGTDPAQDTEQSPYAVLREPLEGTGADSPAPPLRPSGESVGARLREHLSIPLFRNAYALIGSTVLMTGLGVLASLAAARLYSPEDFGRGQSTVNAVILLAGLGNLRLMNVLTRFLPRARERTGWLISRCYLLVIVASLAACTFYLTALSGVLPVSELMGGTGHAGLFLTITVVAFALFTVQDAVLTGLREATWVPLKNGLHGLGKVILVVALAGVMPASGILASWAIPTAAALLPVNLLILRKLVPANTRREVVPEDLSPRRLAPFAAGEYAGALCELAVANLIPLIILARLGPEAAGYFSVAWMIGTTLDHIVMHFGSSLTVEGASDPARMPSLTRALLRRSVMVVGPISAVVVLGAPLLLLAFGGGFAAEASGVLRLLGLALLPRLVCIVAVVTARVRNDVPRVVGIQAALAAGALVGSFTLLSPLGLAGPGIAYLVTSIAVAAAVTPRLLDALHEPAHIARRNDRPPLSTEYGPPLPEFTVPLAAPKSRPLPIVPPLQVEHPPGPNGHDGGDERPSLPNGYRRLDPSSATTKARWVKARWLHAAPVLAAAALAAIALVQVDRTDAGGVLGLAAALPVTWWLAAGTLLAGFSWLVFSGPPSGPGGGPANLQARRWALLAHLVALVVLLHGTPGILAEHARFPTAWTHVGFVDHVAETGTIDPGYDARYNWPGGFSFGAFLTGVTGADSARDLVRFAPVIVNLLLLVPFTLVLRHVTRDQRLRWLAALLFIVTNWIGQDYLAPQPIALLGYLAVVAVLLRWFRWAELPSVSGLDLLGRLRRRAPRVTRDDRMPQFLAPPPSARPIQEFCLVALIVGIGGYLAFSHQLTPFMLVIAAAILIVTGRVDRLSVPLLLAVIAVAWVSLGTTSYLHSHLDELVTSVGDVGGVVEDNQERVGPGTLRQVVLAIRLAITAAVAGLAAVGLWRQWRGRRADWGVAALAAAPVGLALLNSYGGEILLRISMFSLPFLAVLGAFAFLREGDGARAARRAGIAFFLVAASFVPMFVIARYGNEAYERIYSDDIAAWDFVVDRAAAGATVVVPDFAGPWRYHGLTYLDYRVYADEADGPLQAEPLDELVASGSESEPAYLILGTGSDRYRQVAEGHPGSWQDELTADLLATGSYEVVFRSGETRVLERAP